MSTLAVLGSGMVTVLGYNAPATLAALRAGVSGVELTAWLDGESGEPLRGARVSLPQWSNGVDKLADLVAPAIHECLQHAAPEALTDIPVLIGIAHPGRAHRTPGLDDTLLDEVEARLGARLHPDSALFPADETGCVHALLRAQQLLAEHRARRVIVAGVDSFLHQSTLDVYLAKRRLMTESNSNGFFPGEAGTSVLVGLAGQQPGRELRVLGIGQGIEDATIDSTKPLRARGLTDALKQALQQAGTPFNSIRYRLCDLTGEHYRFKEAAFATGRLDTGPRPAPQQVWHPIEYLGAIGAAVLPCLLAQALHAGLDGYAPSALALCHVGSDDGERAALVLGVSEASA
ncbi:MAG: hypothetical protein RLZZ618_1969 [Pseudomonadota bacterium]|jgi:3-oxoacyl-[acyl-carrier-protein] synthase-1